MGKLVWVTPLLLAGAALISGCGPQGDTRTGDVTPDPDVPPAKQAGDFKAGPVPVSNAPFTRTLRSVSLEGLAERELDTGIWTGSPKVQEQRQWYEDNFYSTLASRKVWESDEARDNHERGGPIRWTFEPIPQYTPPPCDQPQPTGYDAEGCRIAGALFKDVEKTDPAKAQALREQVRRGRDVWFKGTFNNQDLNNIHLARTVGPIDYTPWLDTRERKHRFTKWGLINDPDCVQGNAESDWLDICQDHKSTGVLGYRKYVEKPENTFGAKMVPGDDGKPAPPEKQIYVMGHPCVQCHVGFDPTNPPENPNEPEWENIMGLIGNQHTVQPLTFVMGTPQNDLARQVLKAGRAGTIDTSLNPNDFKHNPGTQNNITDIHNRRVFEHEMKHPITGEVKTARTRHVLKGGEDSVGEHLALARVYINIGTCTEECWVPNFPYPGSFFGDKAEQRPMRIAQCYKDCEPWNHLDAKMGDLAAFLVTGGPTYLLEATDLDGTPGSAFIDLEQVPRGRTVFIRECARCHSSKVAPESIRNDKDAMERFYAGHVFGSEEYWQYEFPTELRESAEFREKHLVADENGEPRPRQFAEVGIFGQDWLGNDELTPVTEVGTNMCRAMHDNHNSGHIWEEFASETYREKPSPGTVPAELNRLLPVVGGMEVGEMEIGGGGPGYYRNISLLSLWAIAPFLHNNAVGELTYLPDGSIDYTVAGRIEQYEIAMQRLLMSDDPQDEPHRPQKISRTITDIKVALREDGQGAIKLPVPEGTPVADFASLNPHRPAFATCNDLVENKGHQFGVDLPDEDKAALTEFLKLM